MQRRHLPLFAALAVVLGLFSVAAFAGEVTSRMRTVSGMYEVGGFRIVPVSDVSVQGDPRDLVTPQAYEIIRPDMNTTLTVGRLFTSCSCIQLEAQKRSFGPGERAILVLRNVRATPRDGQMYAFFVQMREPTDTTLRFDTFVQSGVGIGDPNATVSDVTTPAPVDSEGRRPAGDPAPGINNQLAAALAAVGSQPEATADLVTGTPAEPAATAVEETADAAVEKAAGEAAPLEPEAQEAAMAGAGAAPAAEALTDDQVLQLQQLALMQAEEQAKQLAERVLQLQTNAAAEEAHAAPAPAVETGAAPVAPAAAAAPSAPVDGSVQAVSLITIGVGDMAASIRFYEAIGWQRAARGKYDQTAFFQLNGQVLALYPVADLLAEQNMADARPAPGGITLALHVRAKEDVSSVYQRFVDAGGKSLRAPAEMASGAVSSYVADPDGNPWEISWVPQFTIDADGGLWLP